MTKKDYIKLADILKAYRQEAEELSQTYELWKGIGWRLIDMLEADNPRFDREKFISYINN